VANCYIYLRRIKLADKKISALTAATLPLAGTEVLPIVQSSTTDNITVNNLAAGNLKSQSTTGVLQVSGPAAASTRVMTTPDANFTAARTDAGQTFTGNQNVTGVVAVTSSAFVGLSVTRSGAGASSALDIVEGSGGYARIACSGGTSTLSLRPGGTETATLATDLTLNSGNIIPGTAAKGINFTANTPAAGMTSQLLNWYEEGTWTPNQGAGLTVVGAFSSSGRYTRIGRQVFIEGTLSGATSISCGNTAVICSNLPYSVGGVSGIGSATNAAVSATAAVIATGTSVLSTAIAATTTIYFSANYTI
jgi:hypothetical protein